MCILSLPVPQLPERLGQDLSAELRPDSAGCATHACENHWHRGNSLHLQRSLFQVSTAVIDLFMDGNRPWLAAWAIEVTFEGLKAELAEYLSMCVCQPPAEGSILPMEDVFNF